MLFIFSWDMYKILKILPFFRLLKETGGGERIYVYIIYTSCRRADAPSNAGTGSSRRPRRRLESSEQATHSIQPTLTHFHCFKLKTSNPKKPRARRRRQVNKSSYFKPPAAAASLGLGQTPKASSIDDFLTGRPF